MATTPIRNIRIDDELWTAAAAAAADQGERISDVIRRALADYVTAYAAGTPGVRQLVDAVAETYRIPPPLAREIVAGAVATFGLDPAAGLLDDEVEAVMNYARGWTAQTGQVPTQDPAG